MLETIVKQEIIFYAMCVLMLVSVWAKLVSHFTVRGMVMAAGEIHKSNHRLMKLVKAKFEHASMISDRVQNVEAFVNKYIYEYRVLGLRLNTWRMIPRRMLWAVLVLGVVAIFESYSMDGLGALMTNYLQWTGVFALFLLLLGFVADEEIHVNATKNYMVEYLENVCVHRYAKSHPVAEEEPEQTEPEAILEETEEPSEEERKKSEQEIRIRAILEEFMA